MSTRSRLFSKLPMLGKTCHRCSGHFTSRGRLLYHKLAVCPLPKRTLLRDFNTIQESHAEKQPCPKDSLNNEPQAIPQNVQIIAEDGPPAQYPSAGTEEPPFEQDKSTGSWRCRKCSKAYAHRRTVREHCLYSRSCRSEMRFKCEDCAYTTNKQRSMSDHLTSEKACQLIIRKCELIQQLGLREGGKVWKPAKEPLSCPNCGYSTRDSTRMRNHMASKITCKQNKRKYELRHQLGLSEGDRNWAPLKDPLKCSRCSYSTHNSSDMRKHLASKIACKTISRKTELRQQLGLSVGGRDWAPLKEPLKCTRCNYSTRKSKLMRGHLASANGCKLINRKVELRQLLGVHEKDISPTSSKAPLRCLSCDYASRNSNHMRRHLASRVACSLQRRKARIAALKGGRQCGSCERTFANPSGLLCHLDNKVCKQRS